MSYSILLPVDGSEGSARAARHVAKLAGIVQGLGVHVINVQPLGDDWMVRRILKPEELAKLEEGWGESAIAPARAILGEAGVACIEHIEQGDVARTIVHLAVDLACDQIVMGAQGRTALGHLVLGSMAIKVLQLSSVPVTLVK